MNRRQLFLESVRKEMWGLYCFVRLFIPISFWMQCSSTILLIILKRWLGWTLIYLQVFFLAFLCFALPGMYIKRWVIFHYFLFRQLNYWYLGNRSVRHPSMSCQKSVHKTDILIIINNKIRFLLVNKYAECRYTWLDVPLKS